MKLLVVGNPIKHSKSPLIHNYWLKQRKLSYLYERKLAEIKDLQNIVQDLRKDKVKGINITLPFKNEVIKYCDEIEDNTKNTGAINTLYKRNNKIIGANTDGVGFLNSLKKHTNIIFNNSKIFVIGAGGSARGIIFEIIKEPVSEVTIFNRTEEKSIKLKDDLNKIYETKLIKIQNWKKNIIPAGYNLVINTTSYGMKKKENLDIDFSNIQKKSIVCDIIYDPQETLFLKKAKKMNYQIINGSNMLIYQAAESFKRWFNITVTKEEILTAKKLIT